MKQQRALGRGLNALLSNEAMNIADRQDAVKMVNINEVEPNSEQPRKNFNEEELEELRQSILSHGIIQPIIVRHGKNHKYEIVAGERRYRAARLAHLTEIPILIRQFTDQETLEIALIENIQRQELNPMELAVAYQHLMDTFQLSQEEVALKVGKSRPAIANLIRLLKLSPYVQEKLREGNKKFTFGHARALLALDDAELQKKLTDLILEKQMSVREVEKYIQTLTAEKKLKEELTYNPYKEIQENLQKLLGTKVTISKGQKKGKIEIEYYSDEELERIIQLMATDK